ncbi:hypothetical protein SS50377_27425 [Spironucleus salmonicida]|uniref:Uncharacterized protein n=1 Tax=Spironucleus salmonicida TaxID=348837 RepID=A0A9P8LN28_9EUKA|nr:hypothetical protein SS50377_27425 [Spironucleus salmonicida]
MEIDSDEQEYSSSDLSEHLYVHDYMTDMTKLIKLKLDQVLEIEDHTLSQQLLFKQNKLHQIIQINKEHVKFQADYNDLGSCTDILLQKLICQVYELQSQRISIICSEIDLQDEIFSIEREEILEKKNNLIELLALLNCSSQDPYQLYKK